jgi:hypothetical protein
MNNDIDTAMAEFLAKGGVIQQGAYRESGRVEGAPPKNSWGAGKKGKTPVKTEVEDDKDFGDEE